MRGTTVGLVWCLAAGAGLGCDDGGGGSGGVGPAGPCEAVGAPTELPGAWALAAAPHGDGYLVLGEGFGNGDGRAWGTAVIGADGSATVLDEALGRGPLALAGADVALGFSAGGTFDPGEQVEVEVWDGAAWAPAADDAQVDPPEDAEFFHNAAAMALGDDGTLAVAWSAGRPTISGSQVWVHVKRPGEPLGAAELAFAPTVGVRDGVLHLAVEGDGTVHVAATVSNGDVVNLLHKVRTPAGTWAGPGLVGPVPDALSYTQFTGLAASPAGVFAVEAHGADYAAGTDGATVFYRREGSDWAELGQVVDDRPVVVGVAAAGLPDGIVAAVGYGENHLPYQDSHDTVELLRCSTAGCGRALVVAPTPGVFYDDPVVVTRGDEGLVVWLEEDKGPDGAARTRAQRFRCPAAE